MQLPRVVVRHMSSIEERILDSLAWEENSPLLALVADPANQELIAAQARRNPPAPSNSLLALASPSKFREFFTSFHKVIPTIFC